MVAMVRITVVAAMLQRTTTRALTMATKATKAPAAQAPAAQAPTVQAVVLGPQATKLHYRTNSARANYLASLQAVAAAGPVTLASLLAYWHSTGGAPHRTKNGTIEPAQGWVSWLGRQGALQVQRVPASKATAIPTPQA